jgi:hypothetical protein
MRVWYSQLFNLSAWLRGWPQCVYGTQAQMPLPSLPVHTSYRLRAGPETPETPECTRHRVHLASGALELRRFFDPLSAPAQILRGVWPSSMTSLTPTS